MSDKSPTFNVLQDTATEDGKVWHLVAEGDASAAKNAGAVLSFKDESGNLRYPKVDAQDRLYVNTEFDDVVDLDAEGDNAGSGTFVDLATITLQNSKDYKEHEFIVSCFREATFEIVHVDDVGVGDTETLIGTIKVGAGSYTEVGKITRRITSGASGVQELRIRGVNLNSTSQLEASLSTKEVQ